MRKEIRFYPAWDKRSSDPHKNYGISSVDLKFMLYGDRGVIQFVIYTGWHLPEVQVELDGRAPRKPFPYLSHQPMAADLGYHSPVPMYEGQEVVSDNCEYLDGAPCYYDGSSLAADRVFDCLRREGDEGVWRELEATYADRFGLAED